MNVTDQLLSKALSTTSEDEAISCLLMARKKGGSYKPAPEIPTLFKGKTAEQWYAAANEYYAYAKQQKSFYDSLKVTFTSTHSKLMVHRWLILPTMFAMLFIFYAIGASTLASCILF